MPKYMGEESLKIHPKLRMYSDCTTEVLASRAQQSAALMVEEEALEQPPPVLSYAEPNILYAATPREVEAYKAPPLEEAPTEALVNVFIETKDAGEELPDILKVCYRKGSLVAATINIQELTELAKDERVLNIQLGDTVARPTPDVATGPVKAPDASRWRFGSPAQLKHSDEVLIGIIDVQGFDFSHPDFLDNNGQTTRFERIWDQGGNARPSPHRRDKSRFGAQFDFGAEFRRDDLNQAIAASDELHLPAYEIERQSRMVPGSHGTHVASIAAGNRGVCRKAKIAAVLIALPEKDNDRRQSFYDSTRIAEAVDYLLLVAAEYNLPVSINISLGTNGHAHDGSSYISRWIDSSLSAPGRSVCVAAGNAGQEVSAYPGDLGYVMGRIHTSGKISGRYLHKDIGWSVIGNNRVDVSENELEIWYSAQDRFAVSVRPPGDDSDWIGPVEPRHYIENYQLPNRSIISIYNELYHPANGRNYISIYLSPFYATKDAVGKEGIIGVPAGDWTVRLHGLDVRDGSYHGWIERDDPGRQGLIGSKEAWRFPSFFTEQSNVDNTSIGSLACGQRVIGVANLHEAEERINITSSQGPTSDNRLKPDVAAPGTNIVAAKGFAGPNDLWIQMSGTSMACPYVAGVIGLMLTIDRRLTAAQIEGILHRTSRPLLGKSYEWANDAGFGAINPAACLAEAEIVNQTTEVEP